MHYNEFSNTWQRSIAYIDVLTDNNGLVRDSDNKRALFTYDVSSKTVKQVAGVTGESDDGYYYLYLPMNTGESSYPRRIYQDPDYNGDDRINSVDDKTRLKIYEMSDDTKVAGTYEFSVTDAVLIPKSVVDNAEKDEGWSFSALEGNVPLSNFPLVISKPEADTSANDISSPFSTRTVYMTKDLNFGELTDGRLMTT